MMAEHTPGPWGVTEKDPRGCCVIAKGGTICDVGNTARGNWFANARLIAAAPDMLAALELVESEYGYAGDADTCECGEFSDGVIDGKPCEHRIVRAAIAKATGGAQ